MHDEFQSYILHLGTMHITTPCQLEIFPLQGYFRQANTSFYPGRIENRLIFSISKLIVNGAKTPVR
jgi:hypothetical protein